MGTSLDERSVLSVGSVELGHDDSVVGGSSESSDPPERRTKISIEFRSFAAEAAEQPEEVERGLTTWRR